MGENMEKEQWIRMEFMATKVFLWGTMDERESPDAEGKLDSG